MPIEEFNENSTSSNQHQKFDSLLLLNENYDKEENSNTPLSNAFTALTPSHSSKSSLIGKQEKFSNHLISESDLSTGNYEAKIINYIDRCEGTDHWFCKNCIIKGDKWFMMKHPCKNAKRNRNSNYLF